MQVNNTTNYAVEELSMRLGNMAIRAGILHQEVDELKQANQILKDQLKQKEGNANDASKPNINNGQAGEKPAEATPETK